MSTIRAELPVIRIRKGPTAETVVRVIGKSVLMIGLLIAGFVVYEFGVTSYFANRHQGQLESDLEQRVANVETVPVTFTPGVLPDAPSEISQHLRLPPRDQTADIPAAVDAAGLPGEDLQSVDLVSEPVPLAGDALGRIVIPSAGVDWTVVEGVGRTQLRSGAGHMPETALPGMPGNAVISGHRTTYGAPFFHLDRVVPGDLVSVHTATGEHVYEVVDTMVLEPTDVWVTGQWDGSWLTLTTCNPRFASSERLVVFAHLVDGPNAGVILGGP